MIILLNFKRFFHQSNGMEICLKMFESSVEEPMLHGCAALILQLIDGLGRIAADHFVELRGIQVFFLISNYFILDSRCSSWTWLTPSSPMHCSLFGFCLGFGCNCASTNRRRNPKIYTVIGFHRCRLGCTCCGLYCKCAKEQTWSKGLEILKSIKSKS